MYSILQEVVEEALKNDSNSVQGNQHCMSMEDAIRITHRYKHGRCYDESIQVPHGSMISPNAPILPGYNPGK